MDSKRDFKALYSFTHIQQPQTTLRVGMQGIIQQVRFHITGFIIYKSRDTEWIHFQCYSPTHGYAHIINKNECFMFLRRTYYLPDSNVWMLKQKESFSIQHKNYIIENFYFSEIFYASGNLTMAIKRRQRNKQCFAHSHYEKNWFFSIQKRDAVEYYTGKEVEQKSLESLFSL
jgi:hypothetical protein